MSEMFKDKVRTGRSLAQAAKSKQGAVPVLTAKKYGLIPMPVDVIRRLIRNPDELFAKDVNGYDKVLSNPFVQSEFFTLISPIIEADRAVEGYGSLADSILTTTLNRIPNLDNAIEQLLYAYITGVRYVELVWGVVSIDGLRMNIPVEFYPHDTHRFARDQHGSLWMTQDGAQSYLPDRNNLIATKTGNPEFVHPHKMLIHTYRDGDGRFGYGHGEGRNLYRLVVFMNAILEWWADACQNSGRPVKILYVDKEVIQEAVANAGETGVTSAADFLEDEMERMEDMTENDAYATDARNKMETLNLESSHGKTVFFELYQALGNMIRLHISGELMTSSDGDGKGSFALSKTHQVTQAGRRSRLTRGVANVLTTMIEWIVHYNYAYFRRVPPHTQGRVRILTPMFTPAEQLEMAKELGLEVVTEDIFKIIGLTMPSEEQKNSGLTTKLGGGGEGSAPDFAMAGGAFSL